MDAHQLVRLAVGRAHLLRGLSTASACGDYKWCQDNRPALNELDEKIDKALETLPTEVITAARELTNAPI